MNKTNEDVKNYYAKELQKTEDLKTNACCTLVAPPKYIQQALSNVHDEVQAKYYGCGLTIPEKLKGLKVLDLGSGSGRDCYIAAQLVGKNGHVLGVDMTDEQLETARKYQSHHEEVFGYKNITFLKGNIEKLHELDLEPSSFDLIISNCVINLAQDKEKVLKDAFNLLKPGGEMYFSDVYSNRRVPLELQEDKVLWGECLSGALYWNDFLNISKRAGFRDPRVIEDKVITIENAKLEEQVGDLKFFSITSRLFKLESLEDDCEDYGLAVKYKGSIQESPQVMNLDENHVFQKGKITPVCGNSFSMLHDTRFKEDFDFFGDFSTHLGPYEDCGITFPFSHKSESPSSCC